MSQHELYMSLLRPPILHILRAAGFHATRPAALDTLVDIAARYLSHLAVKTAELAYLNHNDLTPTVTDVRMVLEHVGALRPHLHSMEEQNNYDDDMRGMEAFTQWMSSDPNREIRRVAGLIPSDDMAEVEAGLEREDFLAALKKKHSKTGEESRFQGTMLGKDFEERPVHIDGGKVDSIQAWESQLRQASGSPRAETVSRFSSAPLSSISTPLSEV